MSLLNQIRLFVVLLFVRCFMGCYDPMQQPQQAVVEAYTASAWTCPRTTVAIGRYQDQSVHGLYGGSPHRLYVMDHDPDRIVTEPIVSATGWRSTSSRTYDYADPTLAYQYVPADICQQEHWIYTERHIRYDVSQVLASELYNKLASNITVSPTGWNGAWNLSSDTPDDAPNAFLMSGAFSYSGAWMLTITRPSVYVRTTSTFMPDSRASLLLFNSDTSSTEFEMWGRVTGPEIFNTGYASTGRCAGLGTLPFPDQYRSPRNREVVATYDVACMSHGVDAELPGLYPWEARDMLRGAANLWRSPTYDPGRTPLIRVDSHGCAVCAN